MEQSVNNLEKSSAVPLYEQLKLSLRKKVDDLRRRLNQEG